MPLVPEENFTPWGAGYWAPDNMSAETVWAVFLGAWVQLQRPAHVIETGAGAGTITLAIAKALPPDSALVAFEGDPHWNAEAVKNTASHRQVTVAVDETPTADDFAEADLAILDSDPELRKRELRLWADHARRGTYAIVHDVTRRYQIEDAARPSCHGELADTVDSLGIPWTQTPNPRGGAILRMP